MHPTAGSFYPATDNGYSIGQSSNRISVVYAATGTINTSDADEKDRSEEHTSELQSLMRISYAVFRWKKKTYPKAHRSNYPPYRSPDVSASRADHSSPRPHSP